MNYGAINAIGTVLSAIATSDTCIVALNLGLRKPKKSLSIGVDFYEKTHVVNKVIDPRYMILASELNDEGTGPLLLGFNTRNNCTEDVVMVGFSEHARFNHTIKVLVKLLSRIRHKEVFSLTKDGFISIDLRFGERFYPFGLSVLIKSDERQLLAVDCDCIKQAQIDREKSRSFNLKKPLKFFAIGIEGNRYKVTSNIPTDIFHKEKTCHFEKRHWPE